MHAMTGWEWALAAGAGVITLCGAVTALKKLLEPLTGLSRRVQHIELHDTQDKERMEALERRIGSVKKETQAMMKALYAMLGHAIDGNSIEAIKAARAALVEHIIEN